MSLQTRWQRGHAREEADVTVREANRAVVDVLHLTTAYPKQPSLRCNRQMLRQSRQMVRMKTRRPDPVRGRPPQVPSRHARTAALPSRHFGGEMMLVTSSAMHVVRTPGW